MSMFATFPYDDRIELLTDGANYTKRGKFMMATEKVWRSSDCPMFVTGRGNTKMIKMLAEACLACAASTGTFSEAVKKIDAHFARWREANGQYHGKHFQLLIAGWDEQFGFGQFHITSCDEAVPGMPSLQVNTVWGVIYAGPAIDKEKVVPILNETTIKDGAASFGPALCQLARETPMDQWDNPALIFPSVGGHIDLTTLTHEGAVTKRLLTWPDRRFRNIDVSLEATIMTDQLPVKKSNLNVTAPSWVQSHHAVAV